MHSTTWTRRWKMRPMEKKVAETMEITLAKRSTVYKILQNKTSVQVSAKKPGPPKGFIPTSTRICPANDTFLRDKLRHLVHNDFFRQKKLPNMVKIMRQAEQYPELANLSRSTVNRMLRKMGFSYGKYARNSA